jgi:hypothetical protein
MFVAGTRDLRLLVGAGDRAPDGAMVLRFSQRVAIDDEDGIAFGAYLGTDCGTREAVLRTAREGLVEIAVEGTPALGGGRYAGFGPWPSVGQGGVTAFIARNPREDGQRSRACIDGRNAAAMREHQLFRAQCGRRGGAGRRPDFCDGGGGGGRAQRDRLPLSGSGTLREPAPQRYTVVAEVSPDGAAGTPSTSTVLLECLRGLRCLPSADSMNEHRVVDIAHFKVSLQFAPTLVVWHAQGTHGRVKVG